MIGIKRNEEDKARALLGFFPVLAIIGARQVGKTTLAERLCPEWKYIDLENPDDYFLLTENPSLFFERYPENIIIDEAQSWPALFPILRGVIDKNRQKKGRFILTGSSSPELLSHLSESLAGRIATIELGTLKANEYYRKPLSPFYKLFGQKINKKNLIEGPPPLTNKDIHKIWLKGGYPEPVLENEQTFYDEWMKNYRDTYVNRDVVKLFPKLNKQRYQLFISMIAKLSGTIINKNDLSRSLEVSQPTVKEYISIADGTFIWRSLTSFERNIVKAVVKMPKGYIRDTGLLHFLLRIGSLEDLFEDPIVGFSFEAFVIEEILKGLNATSVTNWSPHYYRTRNGAEIDLILDGSFGTVPLEIKYGKSTRLRDLHALSSFVDEHKLPLGILINQSDQVEWLTDKIVQVPVGWV